MTINLKEGHVKLIHCFKMDPNVSPLPGIQAQEGCFAATILLYPAPTEQNARGGGPNASSLPGIQAQEGCFAATILLYTAPTSQIATDCFFKV